MQLGDDGRLGHLTYCTNIHAAEHFDDVLAGLAGHLPRIKAVVSPDEPLGVGLRLAASASESLRSPANLERLSDLLGDDFYVFTLNGFPYGTFHGQTVKDGAYRPDWSEPERLDYTNALASQLAALLPDGLAGTVSTVPGSYKPWLEQADGDDRRHRIAHHLVSHVAHLVQIARETGKRIMLTLEPEPCCMLETVAETVDYFEGTLFSADAVRRLQQAAGLDRADAERAMHEHIGVCYDVCHAAVEYESAAASIASLRAAGIAVGKAQLSSALRIDRVDEATIQALAPFNEPVYLHQTIERCDGRLRRFNDLGDAIHDFRARTSPAEAEWRSHFHVPVFLERMEHFDTTQSFLREVLAEQLHSPFTDHLEVETYTWDVLPEAYRQQHLADAIARELDWVKSTLRS